MGTGESFCGPAVIQSMEAFCSFPAADDDGAQTEQTSSPLDVRAGLVFRTRLGRMPELRAVLLAALKDALNDGGRVALPARVAEDLLVVRLLDS